VTYIEPFASPSDYETAFGASTARTVMDLDAASSVIRGVCRWHIFPAVTETLVMDGPGTPVLMLPTQQLSALTALSETLRGSGETAMALDVDDDVEWSAAGLIWRHDRRCWTSRARGITATVTHGFAMAPHELVRLTLDVAKRAASNPAGLRRSQVGQRAEDYGSPSSVPLLLDEMSVLDPYRRRV
jgi:hypothetical protein